MFRTPASAAWEQASLVVLQSVTRPTKQAACDGQRSGCPKLQSCAAQECQTGMLGGLHPHPLASDPTQYTPRPSAYPVPPAPPPLLLLHLSITDYHPETWNPMWSVGTILTGLLSFMYDNQPTTGSITTSKAEKVRRETPSDASLCLYSRCCCGTASCTGHSPQPAPALTSTQAHLSSHLRSYWQIACLDTLNLCASAGLLLVPTLAVSHVLLLQLLHSANQSTPSWCIQPA